MIDEFLEAVGVKDISEIGKVVAHLVGSELIEISNMLGLVSLSDDEIVVRADKHRNLKICGDFLNVLSMNKNDIVVKGRIKKVEFEGLK